jgi:hypothetical protein
MVPAGTAMTLKPGVPARSSPLPFWEEVFDVLRQSGTLEHVRNVQHPRLQWRLRRAPQRLPAHAWPADAASPRREVAPPAQKPGERRTRSAVVYPLSAARAQPLPSLAQLADCVLPPEEASAG